MGLDQYMYVANKAGQRAEFYEGAVWDETLRKFVNPNVEEPLEIGYRRKHPNLHGWFKALWERQGNTGSFNGDELELTLDDLFELELAVKAGQLPATQGFFFGSGADSHYLEADLKFITDAREAINNGLKVFYNSSW